jgi:hypothetical protein
MGLLLSNSATLRLPPDFFGRNNITSLCCPQEMLVLGLLTWRLQATGMHPLSKNGFLSPPLPVHCPHQS